MRNALVDVLSADRLLVAVDDAAELAQVSLAAPALLDGLLGVVVGQPFANVVSWRVEAASDNGKGKELSEFADSLRDDMSHTWDSFRRCSRSPTR